VSLTLTPMMCARLLRTRRKAAKRFYRAAAVLRRSHRRYGSMLDWVLDRQTATLLVASARWC
jgi:multidrug efflux pump